MVDRNSIRSARPAFTNKIVLEFTASIPVSCEIRYSTVDQDTKDEPGHSCSEKAFGDRYLYNFVVENADLKKQYQFIINAWKKDHPKPSHPEHLEYKEPSLESWLSNSYSLNTKINLNYKITQSTIEEVKDITIPKGCTDSSEQLKISSSYSENIAPINFRGYFTGSSSLNSSFATHAGKGHLDPKQDSIELSSSFLENPIENAVTFLKTEGTFRITSSSIEKELIELENSDNSNSVNINKVDGLTFSLNEKIFDEITYATIQIGQTNRVGYKLCSLNKSSLSVTFSKDDLAKLDSSSMNPLVLTLYKNDVAELKLAPLKKWVVTQSKSYLTNINFL